MKENIKHIILSILILFSLLVNADVGSENPETEFIQSIYLTQNLLQKSELFKEKLFDSISYKKLKEDVDLIQEMEHKRLQEDSSKFGLGYGVEKGDDYVIYQFDSIKGRSYYQEKYRGSGVRNASDGVQPGARSYSKRKEFQRRDSRERIENRKREIKTQELKKREDYHKDAPRTENIDKHKQDSKVGVNDGFFKFLLILIIAVILGVSAYMLFVNSPVQSGRSKIIYDQEMNPDAVQLSELEIKINSAKEEKDFRSATRLYFVWVIKGLSDKGYIQWKKRKTNYHYILEIEGKTFSKDFEIGVKNYEFIWYGKYEVSFEEFELIEKHFKTFIKMIS